MESLSITPTIGAAFSPTVVAIAVIATTATIAIINVILINSELLVGLLEWT
jgi:hypothetical protein